VYAEMNQEKYNEIETKYNQLLDEYNKLQSITTNLTAVLCVQQGILLKAENTVCIHTNQIDCEIISARDFHVTVDNNGKSDSTELISTIKNYILDDAINFIINDGYYYDVNLGKSKKIFRFYEGGIDQSFSVAYTEKYYRTEYLDMMIVLLNNIFTSREDVSHWCYFYSGNLPNYEGDPSDLITVTIADVPIYLAKNEILKAIDATLEFTLPMSKAISIQDLKKSLYNI
jgi:hypothetical protein